MEIQQVAFSKMLPPYLLKKQEPMQFKFADLMLFCRYDKDYDNFKDDCLNTARLVVVLYPLYYMPRSVH